jgi:hypothetical protein
MNNVAHINLRLLLILTVIWSLDLLQKLNLAPSTRANGISRETSGRVKVRKYGLMAAFMKATGRMTKLTVVED